MKRIRRFLAIGLVLGAAAWVTLPPPVASQERPAGPSGPNACIPSNPMITATAGQPSANMTTYVFGVQYPQGCGPFVIHNWTKTGQHCGVFPVEQGGQVAVWDYSTLDCPSPPHPNATITNTMNDGLFICTASYSGGSTSGTGPVGSCTTNLPHCERSGDHLLIFPAIEMDAHLSRLEDDIRIIIGNDTQPIPSCTGHTIFNTGNITLFGSTLDNRFTLDLTGGPFAPNGVPIPINVQGSDGNDTVDIEGTADSFEFKLKDGVSLNGQFVEVTFLNAELFDLQYPQQALDLTFVDENGEDQEWTYQQLSELAAELTASGEDGEPVQFGFNTDSLLGPLKVDGAGGDDTLNIFPAPSEPIEVQIDIDPVLDFGIAPPDEPPVALQPQGFDAFSLNGGGGNLTVNGGGGNDFMTVQSTNNGFQFAPNPAPSSPGVPFGVIGFETFTFEGGNGADKVDIEPEVFDEFNGGTGLLPFMIFGGTGVDGVRVTPPAPAPQPIDYKAGWTQLEVRAVGSAVFAALNADASNDTDAEFGAAGVEKLTLVGGSKKDKISGAGGAGTGTALEIPMVVKGAGGNDKLTGGKDDDKLDGGGGDDTCTGGKGADTFKGCETKKQ